MHSRFPRHYRPPSTDALACVWAGSLPRALRNPSSSPRTPLGFGTGHSRWTRASFSASSSIWKNVATSSSTAPGGAGYPGRAVSEFPSTSFRRRRRMRGTCCPSAVIVISESAKVRRGAGHGKRCGTPTTTSDARRVPAKRVLVDRDLGCRCGGIVKDMTRLERRGGCERVDVADCFDHRRASGEVDCSARPGGGKARDSTR